MRFLFLINFLSPFALILARESFNRIVYSLCSYIMCSFFFYFIFRFMPIKFVILKFIYHIQNPHNKFVIIVVPKT